MKRRLLFVSRTRYRLPLEGGLARKWDTLAERFDLLVLGAGQGVDPRFELVPTRAFDGPRFYGGLPRRVARLIRAFRPDVVIAESPYEVAVSLVARRLARSAARLIVEVHGDWRTSTRMYGSPLRRLVAPAADSVAAFAIRRADGVRTISPYTSGLVRRLGVEPAGEYVAFMDFAAFLDAPPVPLPEQPAALFVGAMELNKNVDGLARAWRLAAPRLPGVRLRLIGTGARRDVPEQLARDLPAQASWQETVPQSEVARALDESTCLILPSRSEGLGRVVLEAFCRARPVVAARTGGLPDLVGDGVNGLLVDAAKAGELADAIVRLLSDGELAARLADRAWAAHRRYVVSPEQYAANVEAVVERVLEQ